MARVMDSVLARKVVPVEMFSADCFSAMARVMDSVLARKVVLASPRLLLSSSEQVATIALANAVNIVSRLACKGELVTWIEIAVTSVANSAQVYSLAAAAAAVAAVVAAAVDAAAVVAAAVVAAAVVPAAVVAAAVDRKAALLAAVVAAAVVAAAVVAAAVVAAAVVAVVAAAVSPSVAFTLAETAVAAAWLLAPCAIAAVTLATLLEAEQGETSMLTLSSSFRQELKLPLQACRAAVCPSSMSLMLQSDSMADMFANFSDSQMRQAAAAVDWSPEALIASAVSFTNPSMVALQASKKVMLMAGILSLWQVLLMLVLQASRLS